MMGLTESPGAMIQGQTCTPIVDRTWRKRDTLKQAQISVTWAVVNASLAFLVFMDMSFGMIEAILEVKYPLIWYIDLALLVIFVLNVATDVFRYFSDYIFGRQVELTEKQRQLLGVRNNDPGFQVSPLRAPSPSSSGSLIFSSTPSAGSPYSPSASPWSSVGGHVTPTNMGSFSGSYSYVSPSTSFTSPGNQSGHVSFDRNASLSGHNVSYSPHLSYSSQPYSPGASMSSLDMSGIRSRLSMSSSFRAPSPGDNITDIHSLSMYLKEQEEKEYKAALSSPDLSMANQSFWSYGRPSVDFTHFLRKNQYQLASRSPQSVRSRSEDTDNMGEEVWGPLGVTDDDLYVWIERLRKWLGQTVMVKLSKEIDNINASLRKIGCEDTEIGEVGVSTLKQLALTKGPYLPTLNVMVSYLDCTSHQEYLVKRLKELGKDGCMSEFSWSSGGLYGKQWGEHLPTDAGLVMHMLCCYLDSRLPAEIKYPDGKTFTSQYFLKTPEKPNFKDKKYNLLIYQSSINPPHFQVVVKNNIYNLPKGRNNLFHAILFFLYHVKKEENGMLGRDSFANTDAIQTDEGVEMREIEFEKEKGVQTVTSQTDREMSLENTEKDDHFSAEDDSLCAEDENLSTEDDNLSVSDKLKDNLDEEDASEEEMTDEDDVDLLNILKCGVEEVDMFPDEELFNEDINNSDHDVSLEKSYGNISALEQSLHDLSIDNVGSGLVFNTALEQPTNESSIDNAELSFMEDFQAISSVDKCNERFNADVSVLETSLHNLSIQENILDRTNVEKHGSLETDMPCNNPNLFGTQSIFSDISGNDHSNIMPANQTQIEAHDNCQPDHNQSLPTKFGFHKNNCSTLLCRHPPPAIGQDNDIHVLQRVLDDVLVKSGYQDKSLTTKEDKILFGPDNKIGSNLIELMKRKKKYELFLPEFPLLHLRKSKITTLISAYKNAGLTQLLRYMLDDEKKEWAKLVDPTDIDIATTKISRVSKALHLAFLVRFIQTLDIEEATSLIASLQSQEPEVTASQWNTRYKLFLTECCKRNATFELHVDIMQHCDEVLAIKLAERLGGESGYQLLLGATKSSLIFAFLNGASYYAPFCTQLLLHHYSTGPFYRNMKYNLFSTPSTQSNLNMAGDTKREMDHRDVLKGFRSGSTLSSVSWRMALIDPLNEVHRIRRQKTTEEEKSQADDLGWKTTTKDLTYIFPLAELILKKGGLSFEEDLVPYNVYASQVVSLQGSVIDSLTSSVGQFLLERYVQKENLADLKTELVGTKTISGPKDLVGRAM